MGTPGSPGVPITALPGGMGITPVPVPPGTLPEHALADSRIEAHPLPQGRLDRPSGCAALAPIRFPWPQPDVRVPLVDDDAPAWVAAWRPPASAYGSCPDGGTHLRLLLDESGSICAADPVAYRHQLLARVLGSLSRACACGDCSVEIIPFGIGPHQSSSRVGPVPWRSARAELAPTLLDAPQTGSYLAPALDRAEQSPHSAGTTVTICLTDLELFDPNPESEARRLARQPHPLLLLLGDGAPTASTDVPMAAIRTDSPDTAVADATAEHITATRPPVDRLATRRQRRRRRPWTLGFTPGCLLLPLLLLFAALIAGFAITQLGKKDAASPAAVAAPAAAALPLTPPDPASGTDGFTIPGLAGNAPRQFPVQTSWWIDPSLQNDPTTLARVRRELPAVVDYQRGYAIPGDTLAMGSAADAPMTQTTLAAAAAAIGPAPAGTASAIQRFGRLRPGTADTQRAVVIVTDRPNAWLGRLPSTAAGAGQGRATQYFIIDTSASGTVPSTLAGAGPWVLPGGGPTAGSVAVATARAWSHAADTGWTG